MTDICHVFLLHNCFLESLTYCTKNTTRLARFHCFAEGSTSHWPLHMLNSIIITIIKYNISPTILPFELQTVLIDLLLPTLFP